jgi:hypothetical protein
MDGIFCNNCGAELDEAPTLLPEQRSPCPTCGSVSRRFDATASVTATSIILADAGTLSGDELIVTKTGPDVQAHAGVATGTGTAYDAEVWTTSSEPITDHLGVVRRLVTWTKLTGKPGTMWFVQVLDESGELIEGGMGDNQDDALLAIIDALRPPDPA